MAKPKTKPGAKSLSKPPAKPKTTATPKTSLKAPVGPTSLIWLPGRYLRPVEEFYCINEKCLDYDKRGLDNMYHHTWSGGMSEPKRLIKCKTCKKSKIETKWDFPEMPTSPFPPITDEQEFLERVMSTAAKGRPKEIRKNTHVLIDKEDDDEMSLYDQLNNVQNKVREIVGKDVDIFTYIAKTILLEWSKGRR